MTTRGKLRAFVCFCTKTLVMTQREEGERGERDVVYVEIKGRKGQEDT